MLAVTTRTGSPLPRRCSMPSGAASTQIAVTSVGAALGEQPDGVAIDPPVASIGSSTNTGRPASDSGSDSMYGIGWWVSSSRAIPTNPICASGIERLRGVDHARARPAAPAPAAAGCASR